MNQIKDVCSNWIKPYRPFFFESIAGITAIQNEQDTRVLLSDKSQGILAEVDLISEIETFSKKYDTQDYVKAESVCYYDGEVYSVFGSKIYNAKYRDDLEILKNKVLGEILNFGELVGIAVTQEKIYLTTKKSQFFPMIEQPKSSK
jgi:hypothetical protein